MVVDVVVVAICIAAIIIIIIITLAICVVVATHTWGMMCVATNESSDEQSLFPLFFYW